MKPKARQQSLWQPFWSSLDKRRRVLSLERLESLIAPNSLINPVAPLAGLPSVGPLAEPVGADHGSHATSGGPPGGTMIR